MRYVAIYIMLLYVTPNFSCLFFSHHSNHFRDHLKRVQGKESTIIPEKVLSDIRTELSTSVYGANSDLSAVTPQDIRKILKRLGQSKLYNHTIRIWSLTTGNQPPNLTLIQEQELLSMFQLIQAPWKMYKLASRSNMLSYSYIINKM
jgi:Poxvirus Late Transcription Factor VLTF3 like